MSSLSSSSSKKFDPLILLRRAISSRNDIHLISSENQKVFTLSECTTLSLPGSSGTRILIPKTLVTRYRKPDSPLNSNPINSPEHFYDVQSILLCYLNRENGFGSYVQEAKVQKCNFVTAIERKSLNDYLESKNSIEPNNIIQLDSTNQSIYQDLYNQFQPNSVSKSNLNQDDQSQLISTTNAQDTSSTSHQNLSVETQNGVGGAVVGPSPNKRARYIVDKTDQELVKRIMKLHEIRQVSDRKSVLRGNSNKLVNFENARSLVLDRIKSSKEDLRNRQGVGGINGAPGLAKQISTPGSNGTGSAKRRPMNPIIIISPSSSALITMHNVKRFLEDAVFEPPNALRASGSQSTASEDVVEVRHRRGYTSSQVVLPSTLGGNKSSSSTDRAARYFVVDGVDALSKFGEDAWDRVVCVMTTGQEWQFRPYRWSDPKELFHHVKGFFMQWTHDPPNPKVRAWNVTELRIDQSKRHIDKSAAADFWRSLEAWIALHKPFVAY